MTALLLNVATSANLFPKLPLIQQSIRQRKHFLTEVSVKLLLEKMRNLLTVYRKLWRSSKVS